MFNILAYLQFLFVFLSFIISPLVIISSKKNYKFFGVLVFELVLAQLFMYEPGLDVSPYAMVYGKIYGIKIGGFTLSSLTSIAIDWFVVSYLLLKNIRIPIKKVWIIVCALLPNVWAFFFCDSFSSAITDFVKIMTPFLVFIYLDSAITTENVHWYVKVITIIDMVLVGQVLVCKLIYGSFSAHNYYYEIAEETFGYYNHPHPFTALLAFFVIWNVYRINKKHCVLLNMVLACGSLIIMWFSGVRAYVVAIGVGLAVIGGYTLFYTSMRRIRKYVLAGLGIAVLFGPTILASFGSQRANIDFSSGRFARWGYDCYYVFSNSLRMIILGGGYRNVERINHILYGYDINSLNLIVDDFVNYGILGLVLLLCAYFMIFKSLIVADSKGFQMGVLATFLVASVINSITIYVLIILMMVIMLSVMRIETLRKGNNRNNSESLSY